MQNNSNFKFEVSLSKEAYSDKVISGAMIGTTLDKQNKEIRKQYGFNPNKGIGFERTMVTSQSLLDALLGGHVFCHLFNPTKVRIDGTFGSCEKKNDNFIGSWVIGVDIDKTSYKTAEEFVAKLSLQPTFYYTSYSNQQKDKGARFRLIYVFDKLIINPYFFRYCAYNLNRIIERDTKELIEDDCNLRCSQYFNGTNKNNPDVILYYGITNNIYSLEDIGVDESGFIDFLRSYCHYSSTTTKKTVEIKKLLDILDNVNEPEEAEEDDTNSKDTLTFSQEVEEVLNDWDKQSETEFKRNYKWERLRQATPYVYRVEGDWINEKYQFVDSSYFQLFYYKEKLEDGQMRKKTLFQRMCLRRVIKPGIDLNEMAVNILIDIMRFFDNSDRTLNSDFIKSNILSAYELSLDEIEKENHYSIKYLREVFKPRRGVIYNGKANYSGTNIFEILDEIYNRNLGIKDNWEILNNDYGFIISEHRLYEYTKDRGIKPEPKSLTDEELKTLINPTISARKNIDLLRKMGYKFKDKRVRGLVRVMCCEVNCSMDSLKESNTTTINNRSEKGRTFEKNDYTFDYTFEKNDYTFEKNDYTFEKNDYTLRDSKKKNRTLEESNKDTIKESSLMKEKDKEIYDLINPNLSVRKNLDELKGKGYKIGIKKVNKLLNMKKEESLNDEIVNTNVKPQEENQNQGFSFKGISINLGLPTLKFNVPETTPEEEEPNDKLTIPVPTISGFSHSEDKDPEAKLSPIDNVLEDFTLDDLYKDFYNSNNMEMVEDEENSWLASDYKRVMVI